MLSAMKSPMRVAIVVLAVGAVVAVAAAVVLDDPAPVGLGELAMPPIGSTESAFLHDGHPVFVAHDVDGTISVIDAISVHIAEDQMGWCPTSRTIDDIFHGSRWDAQGRYISGPGPSDLGLYEYDLSSDGESLVVVRHLGTSPRTQSPTGAVGPFCVDGGYEIHPYHASS